MNINICFTINKYYLPKLKSLITFIDRLIINLNENGLKIVHKHLKIQIYNKKTGSFLLSNIFLKPFFFSEV